VGGWESEAKLHVRVYGKLGYFNYNSMDCKAYIDGPTALSLIQW